MTQTDSASGQPFDINDQVMFRNDFSPALRAVVFIVEGFFNDNTGPAPRPVANLRLRGGRATRTGYVADLRKIY